MAKGDSKKFKLSQLSILIYKCAFLHLINALLILIIVLHIKH